MNHIKIVFESDEKILADKVIFEELKKFNISKLGPFVRINYSIYSTDDNGNIIGGLSGDTLSKVCSVHLAWVHEDERHKGVGTTLFQKLEEHAKSSGCEFIQLDTAEFQAKEFYEKLGYFIVATLPEDFCGYTRYIMRKSVLSE